MRKALMTAAATVLLAGLMKIGAGAQLDPGLKVYLMRDGVRVGEVFVPERDLNATQYEEHWVLYGNYTYPGPADLRGLVIKAEASERPYRDANDFFRRVPWGKNFRYVHITATESPVKAPIAR